MVPACSVLSSAYEQPSSHAIPEPQFSYLSDRPQSDRPQSQSSPEADIDRSRSNELPRFSPPAPQSPYHGQNNNQSPDASKKRGFLSIASMIQTNDNTAQASPSKAHSSPSQAKEDSSDRTSMVYQPSSESVYESAVQLLYMSVTWARNIPTFLDLPFRDQAILLEEGWSELFVLSAAQFSLPVDMGPLLSAAGLQVDKAPTDKIVAGMADIRLLQNVVARFKRVQIDSTEYACLKAIVLFKPGKLFPLQSGVGWWGGAWGKMESYLHTYIYRYSKILKRRVWRLTLYYNSSGKIRVKCVKLCT